MTDGMGRQWFEQAFASSPHGMLMLDAQGVIEQVNDAAARLFGWPPDELTGRPIDVVVAPSGRRKLRMLRERFARGSGLGRPRGDIEIPGQHRLGREFKLAVGLAIIDRAGRPHVIVSVADLSRRQRAEARIKSQNDALRDAVAQRTAELEAANAQLRAEVEERRRTERELRAMQRRLQEMNDELTRLAMIDALTGLANRRHFESRLPVEHQRSARTGSPLSLVLIDIDHFKAYNDHAGHPAGDECLRRVAEAIADCLRRPADLVARFGGEELVALLPDTPHEGALQIARAMRAAVRAAAIRHPTAAEGIVTVSIGVASTGAGGRALPSTQALIEAADRALYTAKARGRDRVWSAGAAGGEAVATPEQSAEAT